MTKHCRYHRRQELHPDMASGALTCPRCREESHKRSLESGVFCVEHARVIKDNEPEELARAI
ncbi:MAG TPA: hypothetical protein VM531_11175 [Sphingomicrobium sp.]|jgi:hypothetical protein|nr:hypothetical protein [Sphingomicrobium sp.]